LALAVPLSRFTSPVGGGSAFFVRQQAKRGMSERHLPQVRFHALRRAFVEVGEFGQLADYAIKST